MKRFIVLMVLCFATSACGGGGGAPSVTTTQTSQRDISNVKDANKLSNTIITAVNLMNSKLQQNPLNLDELYTKNRTEFVVPIQNYLGSNSGLGLQAKIIVYSKPASRTPSSMAYFEIMGSYHDNPYDDINYSDFAVNFLAPGGCSYTVDINNPTPECVQYNYDTFELDPNSVHETTSPGHNYLVTNHGQGSVNLVKTITNGLTYLELPK